MSIYTKKGDKGETSLFDPKKKEPLRLSKDSLQIEAIGALDELNSFLGIAKSQLTDKNLVKVIVTLQKDLFTTASILAGSNLPFAAAKVTRLEKAIDSWANKLPEVKNFIISGGSYSGTLLFYARTLARRAERRVVGLAKVEKVRPTTLKFLNRLSDYLWMFSRFVNHSQGGKEEYWLNRQKQRK